MSIFVDPFSLDRFANVVSEIAMATSDPAGNDGIALNFKSAADLTYVEHHQKLLETDSSYRSVFNSLVKNGAAVHRKISAQANGDLDQEFSGSWRKQLAGALFFAKAAWYGVHMLRKADKLSQIHKSHYPDKLEP